MCGNGDCRPLMPMVFGPDPIVRHRQEMERAERLGEEIAREWDRIQRSGRVGDIPEFPNPINDVPPAQRAAPCPCCGAVHKPKTLAERLS